MNRQMNRIRGVPIDRAFLASTGDGTRDVDREYLEYVTQLGRGGNKAFGWPGNLFRSLLQ
jgi:hypothetical protein